MPRTVSQWSSLLKLWHRLSASNEGDASEKTLCANCLSAFIENEKHLDAPTVQNEEKCTKKDSPLSEFDLQLVERLFSAKGIQGDAEVCCFFVFWSIDALVILWNRFQRCAGLINERRFEPITLHFFSLRLTLIISCECFFVKCICRTVLIKRTKLRD